MAYCILGGLHDSRAVTLTESLLFPRDLTKCSTLSDKWGRSRTLPQRPYFFSENYSGTKVHIFFKLILILCSYVLHVLQLSPFLDILLLYLSSRNSGDLYPQNFKHVCAFPTFLMCSLLVIRYLAYLREV